MEPGPTTIEAPATPPAAAEVQPAAIPAMVDASPLAAELPALENSPAMPGIMSDVDKGNLHDVGVEKSSPLAAAAAPELAASTVEATPVKPSDTSNIDREKILSALAQFSASTDQGPSAIEQASVWTAEKLAQYQAFAANLKDRIDQAPTESVTGKAREAFAAVGSALARGWERFTSIPGNIAESIKQKIGQKFDNIKRYADSMFQTVENQKLIDGSIFVARDGKLCFVGFEGEQQPGSGEQKESTEVGPESIQEAMGILEANPKTLEMLDELGAFNAENGISNEVLRQKLTADYGEKAAEAIMMLHENPELKSFVQSAKEMGEKHGLTPEQINTMLAEKLAAIKAKKQEAGSDEDLDEEPEAGVSVDDDRSEGVTGNQPAGRAKQPKRLSSEVARQKSSEGEAGQEQLSVSSESEARNLQPGQLVQLQATELNKLLEMQGRDEVLAGGDRVVISNGESTLEGNFVYDNTDQEGALKQAIADRNAHLKVANLLQNSQSLTGEGVNKLDAFQRMLSNEFGPGSVVNRSALDAGVNEWQPGMRMSVKIERGKVAVELKPGREEDKDSKQGYLTGTFSLQS